MPPIPFNRACLVGNEMQYIKQAVASGRVMGNGHYTKQCEMLLEKLVGAQKVLLTTSCTSALEMAALLLDLHPDDEVIVPSFAFVSTANAFVLHGAKPVFADIRPDTLNLDEEQVAKHITDKTRAIVPIHYAGVACDMKRLSSIAQQKGLVIVEDNAHGLSGKYDGKALGTFGQFATLSFHETKNYTCGEGGALLINDEQYIQRAEIIREKGTNRNQFFRGEVNKYTWVDVGSSYVLSDILAAMLLGQLECCKVIYQKRKKIWERYYEALESWAASQSVRLPMVPEHCQQAYHIFYLILPNEICRDRFIRYLQEQQIYAVFHYLPLHTSVMGQRMGGRKGDCPVTEEISSRLVRLPLYVELAEEEQNAVIQSILPFTCS